MTLPEKIAADLKQGLVNGRWNLGQQMPTINGIQETDDVGIRTVVSAYRGLIDNGWIESKQGSAGGYFVVALP